MAAIEDDIYMKKYYDESWIPNNKLILCQRQWREIEKGMSKYLQNSHNKAMKSYTDFPANNINGRMRLFCSSLLADMRTFGNRLRLWTL